MPTVCADQEAEQKGSLHPAVSHCQKMSWEASAVQDHITDAASDDGVVIEPLKWIQVRQHSLYFRPDAWSFSAAACL